MSSIVDNNAFLHFLGSNRRSARHNTAQGTFHYLAVHEMLPHSLELSTSRDRAGLGSAFTKVTVHSLHCVAMEHVWTRTIVVSAYGSVIQTQKSSFALILIYGNCIRCWETQIWCCFLRDQCQRGTHVGRIKRHRSGRRDAGVTHERARLLGHQGFSVDCTN